MVLLSVLLNFFMEFQAHHAVEQIRKQVATFAAVLRDGKERELPVAQLLPGDIVILNAGDLVPADGRLLSVRDLHVPESALTGESLPVEKSAADLPPGPHSAVAATNSVFLGTAVQIGIATVLVVATGRNTALSAVAHDLSTRPPETEFGRGIRQFGSLITRVILALALFAVHAEREAIFARVAPEQKNRVNLPLEASGHVVGFIGDGINDAPSLHTADVGISVMEGRRCFANIMKYIVMGTSSNFGNMFSMAGASLFLPFLPMLPTQILLNNFLYDSSQISIPGDNVDPALLTRPKRWQINFIRQFMMIIGPISSVYDFLTFGVLLFGFHGASNAPLFRTAWFVESLATQTLVVFVIRTAGNPFQSRPGRALLLSVLAVAAIAGLAITYLLVVQLVKTWFYRRHALL